MKNSLNSNYHAIRNLKLNSHFKKGDVLVLFGELFSKGYANGLVDEAEKRGMKIIRSTVGRRDKDGTLRPLTPEEAGSHPAPFINIPLEAGFDLEKGPHGISPVEALKDVKLNDWENFKFPEGLIQDSQEKGRIRFQNSVELYMKELENHIPPGANVLFAHLMAGGVPRAKIVLPIINRMVKGTGDRYVPSEQLIPTDIGQFCLANFQEVTAETLRILVKVSQNLRDKIQLQGGQSSIVAYGYHGTEILIGQEYRWQTYTPYFQGWAKMKLEEYSREASQNGVKVCVYNCPEILTNSSSIFNGVELSLYPLLGAIGKETQKSPKWNEILNKCLTLMKPGTQFEDIMKFSTDYQNSPEILEKNIFSAWPQNTSQVQLEKMLKSSDYLVELHTDSKNLITFILSEVVFSACGKVMLNDSPQPEAPVSWINHDVIAKIFHS